MKNIIATLFITVAVLVTWSSQAMALAVDSFSFGSLNMVVYNADDNEVAVSLMDIGWLADVQSWAPGTTQMVADPGTVDLSQFGSTVTGWKDLSMAAVAFSFTGDAWYATTKETRPRTSDTTGAFAGAGTNTHGWWQVIDADDADQDSVSVGPSAYKNSYPTQYNLTPPSPGIYGGLNYDYQDGETILSALDSAGGFAEMYIWHQQAANRFSGPNTPYEAILRLNSDGSVLVTNPAAAVVPEPASLLLIGSGLIGLVGLKRMKA